MKWKQRKPKCSRNTTFWNRNQSWAEFIIPVVLSECNTQKALQKITKQYANTKNKIYIVKVKMWMPYNTIHPTVIIQVPLSSSVPVPATLHQHLQWWFSLLGFHTSLSWQKTSFLSQTLPVLIAWQPAESNHSLRLSPVHGGGLEWLALTMSCLCHWWGYKKEILQIQ